MACVFVADVKGASARKAGRRSRREGLYARPLRPRSISSALSRSCGQILLGANERRFLDFHALPDNVSEPLLGTGLPMQSCQERDTRREIGQTPSKWFPRGGFMVRIALEGSG